AKKTGTGVGEPNGPYGEIYAARRAHTAISHPDWTPGHAQDDALRVMMKAYLRDLWIEWMKAEGLAVRNTNGLVDAVGSAAGHECFDAQGKDARRAPLSS